MTLLGKVFILVILLLSGIFFSLALAINASHTNWRDAVVGPTGYQARMKQLNATITELKAEIERSQNKLAMEQSARRSALASLQTQLAEAQGKLAEKEGEVLKLGSSLSTLSDTLKESTAELARLTNQNEEIKKLIDSTIQDRNSQRTKVIALTDEANNLQSQLADAQAQAKQLIAENTLSSARINIMRSTLVKAGIKEDPDDVPPEGLKGQILAVGKENLVEVSLGKDDGVNVNHEFEVFRGAQYLGKIRILQAYDDKSIGGVLPGFRKGSIQQGDNVAARIQ